jgi:pimeloyl-ACP methyl ester carboxylesterase
MEVLYRALRFARDPGTIELLDSRRCNGDIPLRSPSVTRQVDGTSGCQSMDRTLFSRRAEYMSRLVCGFAFATLMACSATSSKHSPIGVREEQVRFSSGDVRLAGTLVLPGSPGPHAGVVLFHGSGPEGRNLSMARWFAEQGVAALTYDKRGVGESEGNFREVPFMRLADDGLAAVDFLHARADIDGHKIGVWGLSQGGWLGPLAASRSPQVAFVISVSGPGVSPGEQMIFYYASQLRLRGLSENDIREASALRREVWNALRTDHGSEHARADLDRSRSAAWYNEVKDQEDNLFGLLQTPTDLKKTRSTLWFREEMGYDPVPTLQKLVVPALFIFGADDELVPVKQSVDAINAVSNAAKKDFTVVVFPHADHTLHTVTEDGRRNLVPEYLQRVHVWLARSVG